MKKIINILLRIIVMAVVCAATVYFVNIFQNRNYKNLAAEMTDSELPLAYVSYGDSLLNCMHGFTGDVDTTLLRDSITPIDDNKHIEIAVSNTENYAESYSYEVRSISGNSLIENGELEAADNGAGYDVLGIYIRMDLKPDMEYMLVVRVKGRNGGQAGYYTRIVVNDNYHESELLAAVKEFHDAEFDFDALESESVIGRYKAEYLSGTADENYGLGHINLANSYSEITWSGLKPTVIGDINTLIKEIDVNYAVIELEYRIKSTTEQDVTSYYSVKEFFKISYKDVEVEDGNADGGNTDDVETSTEAGAEEGTVKTEPKISLMCYDRYVDEYFDRAGVDAINNVYEIGVVSSDDLEYVYTGDNKKLAFVRNGQLWFYDYEEGMITLVFSFWRDNYTDESAVYDQHDINIIELKDSGDMTFAVYGYMNSGEHEGKLGIALYAFDYADLELDELLFVECNVPYEAMMSETSRLTYYDGSNFYYMLGGKVNSVDISEKKQSYIAENLSSRDVKVSADMSVMAYGESDVQSENTKITLMNIATGNTYEINASNGQCLICYGFKDSDMIYGVSDIADADISVDSASFKNTRYSEESRDIIPASKLYIVGSDGQQIKEYSKSGCYLMQVDLDTNILYLTRGEKNGDRFTAIKDDFITFKEDDKNPTVSTAFKSSLTGYVKLYFTVPSNIYLTYAPSLNITKEKSGDAAVNMITTIVRDRTTYHVYDNLGLSKIYDVAGDAINYAISIEGIVVSSEGEVIYRKTESQEFNTIAAAIFHHSTGTVDGSLSDCIYMVLTYEGVQVTEDDVRSYTDTVQAMNELGSREAIDITGLSLDMVLGYVSDGIPVISRIDDGRYVLVVSYNDWDVRYYDPVIDEEVVVSREEYEKLMSAWGDELYTYVDN